MKLRQLLENQSQFLQTREEIEAWLQKMKIKNYTINDDLTVDVDGAVYIFDRMLKKAYRFNLDQLGILIALIIN